MKHIILAIVLALSTVSLTAKEFLYGACTADVKLAIITVDLKDEVIKAHPEIPAHYQKAFTNAALDLTAAQLRSNEGFFIFLSYLSDLDLTAMPDGGIDPPEFIADCPDTKN